MLKFLNSVLLVVILCGDIHSIYGEALQCKFGDVLGFTIFGNVYTCSVTALDNPNDNKIITRYSGNHQPNKNDTDVSQLYIERTNTTYIPAGLGSLFNLTVLIIYSSELVEIRSKDFQGMQNLEYLSLSENKLTSVPSDIFSTLTKLKYVSLMSNQIEELSSELFSNNQNLEVIDFDDNRIKYIGSESFNGLTNLEVASDVFSSLPKLKLIELTSNQIKYIGSGAFDQLTSLKDVYLDSNICVNKEYRGASGIIQMKEDIITNCKNPDEVPATTTTTTTTTTQNPMEVELEALKNEAKEQQQNNEIELNKLRDDLKKEQLENRKVKIERDAWIEEKNALINDKDSLKIELNNKTAEINELKEALQKMSLKLDNQQTECETKTQELMSKISHSIQPTEEELICDFNDETYNIFGLLYSCDVTSLDNTCNNKVIKGQNGVHQVNRNASNVKAIYIFNTNATHIPKGLENGKFGIFQFRLQQINLGTIGGP